MLRQCFALSCLVAGALVAGCADAASNVVQYTHDAADNIVAIQRVKPAPLTLAGFAPGGGSPGTAVTITGTGFAATAAQNVVSFNGMSAPVGTASMTSLTVTVPQGASTGKIAVTVAGNSATSAQDFVVTTAGVPSISSFTPASGPAGTVITVAGTNLNPVTGATTVRLNQNVATASSLNATSLSFTVPSATGSGRIVVATPAGTGMSNSDFIVPPSGIAATDIIATTRLVTDGTARNIGLYSTNKFGLVLFDGTAGALLSVQVANFTITPASSTIAYTIYKPDSTPLSTGVLSPANLSIHLPVLPLGGTYSLLLRTGLAQVSLDARVESSRFVPTDAAPLEFARTAGQSTRVLIAAVAGEQKAFTVSGLSVVPANSLLDVQVLLPNGSTFRRSSANGLGTTIALPPFTVTGTHSVLLLPLTAADQTMYKVSLLQGGTLTVDGPPIDVPILNPGEGARITFAGAAGDNLGLGVSGVALASSPSASVSVAAYKPDASLLASTVCSADGTKCAINLANLPAAGAYTVIVQPVNGATGSQRLWLSRDVVGTLVNGAPLGIALSRPGQNARLAFSATTGQLLRISWSGVASIANYTSLNVISPAGSTFALTTVPSNGSGTYDIPALPTSGTYTLVVDPPGSMTLNATVRIAPR